jgi:hypothetical protein
MGNKKPALQAGSLCNAGDRKDQRQIQMINAATPMIRPNFTT